jgi:hypothetical protein
MFYLFQTHVVSVFSGCCICCKCMFQMFNLFEKYIAIVSSECFKSRSGCSHVELLSEEERASAETMSASMWGRGADRASPVWRRQGVIRTTWKR